VTAARACPKKVVRLNFKTILGSRSWAGHACINLQAPHQEGEVCIIIARWKSDPIHSFHSFLLLAFSKTFSSLKSILLKWDLVFPALPTLVGLRLGCDQMKIKKPYWQLCDIFQDIHT
jgi:hypothetical protein